MNGPRRTARRITSAVKAVDHTAPAMTATVPVTSTTVGDDAINHGLAGQPEQPCAAGSKKAAPSSPQPAVVTYPPATTSRDAVLNARPRSRKMA